MAKGSFFNALEHIVDGLMAVTTNRYTVDGYGNMVMAGGWDNLEVVLDGHQAAELRALPPAERVAVARRIRNQQDRALNVWR